MELKWRELRESLAKVERVKTIIATGKRFVVYSVDGRSWTTNKPDLEAFERRYLIERRELVKAFERIDTGEERIFQY